MCGPVSCVLDGKHTVKLNAVSFSTLACGADDAGHQNTHPEQRFAGPGLVVHAGCGVDGLLGA